MLKHTNRIAQSLGLLALLLLGWFAFRDAVSQSLAKTAPQVVLRLDPAASEAINQIASLRVARQPAGSDDRLRAWLARSIAANPLSPAALRLYGASYGLAKRDPRSHKFFALAERTSRRDVGTQMYFIIESATKGDAAQTVGRIDRTLRTSRPSRGQLFPILGRVIQLPGGSETLAGQIRNDTPWLSDFLLFALDTGVDPAAIARLVGQTGFPGGRQRPIIEQVLFRTLEGRHNYRELAAVVPRMATAPPGLIKSVAVTEQTLDPDWQPLSWQLVSTAGMVVNPIASANGKDIVLNATLSGGISAEAARKLVLLDPGRYRLTVTQDVRGGEAGNEPVEPRWQLDCLDSAPAIRPMQTAPSGPSGERPGASIKDAVPRGPLWTSTSTARTFLALFDIPADCRVQVLSLRVRARSDAANASMTAGPLSLRQIS